VPRPDFRHFLDCGLRQLAVEARPWFERVARELEGLPLSVSVDGPPVILEFEAGRHSCDSLGSPVVALNTSRAVLLDLVDGRTSLPDAIRSDRLQLRGPVRAVIRFDRAFMAFLDGAVHCPSFPTLLHALREGANPWSALEAT
jgi:hypothetical protein